MGLQVPDDYEPLHGEDVQRMMAEAARKRITVNNERAAAIVAGANLEESLGEVLSRFMIEGQASEQLLRDNLRDLSSRIRFVFSLGLISQDEYKDLDTIRKIRNYFAHEKECSFEDRKVVDLTSNLLIPRQRPDLFNGLTPYETFDAVVLVLSENLFDRASEAKKVRRTTPEEIDPKTWEGFWC